VATRREEAFAAAKRRYCAAFVHSAFRRVLLFPA
jgi:hypothetical protein